MSGLILTWVTKRVFSISKGLLAVNIVQAINWAIDQGVNIINLSLGFPEQSSHGLRRALERANYENIAVFAAAANHGNCRAIAWPARDPDLAICVTSADESYKCSLFAPSAAGRDLPMFITHDLPNPPKDDNAYTLGAIGSHNIVIACLPQGKYGTNSAATVATRMASTFPSIRLGFMVGIGGGIPPNVRLGDVVVSSPGNGFPGVVQWDFGKAEDEGKLVQTGALNNPPTALLTAVSKLRTKHDLTGARIPEYLYDLATNYPRLALRYAKPAGIRKPVSHNSQRGWFTWHGILSALLDAFLAFVWYSSGVWALTAGNGRSNNESTLRAAVEGSQRQSDDIPIHYGPIASGNRVIKDAKLRDRINNRFGGHVLCVEMEAAGLMDNFPCLVIRGVCDYADSAKNKEWQEYAAAVAAAYAKEIISMVPLDEVQQMDAIQKTIQRLGHQLDQMGATSSAIHSIVQGLEANTHYSEVEKWLSPPDPSTNYSHAKKQRHGCSGEWLLRRTEYSAWKSGQRPFLWLHGIPGCGKTILASTVLRDLEDDASIENLLYFFFDFTDTRKQSFEHALRSLVIQLYRKNKDTQENLDLLFASSETGKQQPSVHSLCNTFAAMAEQAGEVNIILDALDECRLQDDYRTEGLFPWMRSFVDSPQKNGGECGNALQAASYRGHEKVVGVLLNKDADVNAKGGRFGNALTAASYGGHEKVVRILLNKGADVNAKGGMYGNALQAASLQGHEKMVSMLLSKGADVNGEGGEYGSALQAASYRGHEKAVRILLDKGADVNANGGRFGNALQAASHGGHDNVVRILLDKGADVNAEGSRYGNALQAASDGGHEEVVRMLLAKGADVNTEDRTYVAAAKVSSLALYKNLL
ncbi:nacht and ankyrin domain-containingprotein [Purpureocillium lilacinum]|uniref:Nacht and ankyrin domain-containingprotein n=1 Tax=Purpureocillium lilacinum TaxID=33203 RepID=A0A179F4R5_PURLI|nr:nacht and ankyrin domain-containingprotein [Purpureocillium lilacinum]